MRNLIIIALLTYAVLTLAMGQTMGQQSSGGVADSISGSYSLYKLQEPDKGPVGNMVITARSGDRFLIRGAGWVGEGKVEGEHGYYDWKFDDGRTGRTTFVIISDGTLKGHVLGSGLDWWYLARRAGGVQDLTKAIEQNPTDASAYIKRGRAYQKMKQYDNAITDFSKAISLDPNNPRAYANRGLSYSWKGEYDKTIEDCTKAISLDPNFVDAYYHRGGAYSWKQMFERAIEDYTKLISLRPDNGLIYALRGNVYEKMGLHKKAAKDYQTACDKGLTLWCK